MLDFPRSGDILFNYITTIHVQWSFGVTCWEVFSLGKSPYPGMDPLGVVRYLEGGKRLERPLNAACSEKM